MTAINLQTAADVERLLRERSNWGRWGEDDQKGTVNLITPAKVREGMALVSSGTQISLSRPYPVDAAPNNANPAEQKMATKQVQPGYGAAVDYYGIWYHGLSCTHLDALCHIWGHRGIYGGRDAEQVIDEQRASWGGVEQWAEGIFTRGVLLDVPGYRGEKFVDHDNPVTAADLRATAARQGTKVGPGDALIVYCGRDEYDRSGRLWGGEPARPGLHADCLVYFRDTDCAVLAWDMQDQTPNSFGLAWTTHQALIEFGLPLVDHCELGPLAAHCRETGRHDFLFTATPLNIAGGTGSPVNPIAVF
jgi:kynurenine formamidase